ncbi:hypothetical protein, partial [Pseudomonas syringae group genomosp. 3]|uniref:hypothetical protein n=1 Tax=Pseudomonas syringae group genomosp. 3 TaxID=251701 RepID=UPI0035C79D08
MPMLCVGMQFWTLCVLYVALRVSATALEKRFISTIVRRSASACSSGRSASSVALHVTQGVCDVRGIDVRLKAPFRPS